MPKQYDPAYYQRNRAKIIARSKEWHRTHPGVKRLQAAAKYEKHRARTIALKLEEGCVDCGYRENADALEFDHVRGKKIERVSRLIGGDINLLSAEILKCDVRCCNCHAIATAARRKVSA